MYLQCTVNLTRFFGAHQDNSDKVENNRSLKKFRERITSWYIIGDGSLKEVELKLKFTF